MSEVAVAGGSASLRGRLRGAAEPAVARVDARRALQLGLAASWLLDGVLQYQPFMYTKGFGQSLADGTVIIYALLAVLLWPADRPGGWGGPGGPAPFIAARAVGAQAARALWLVFWLSLAYFALLPANRAPQALHGMIAGMESGEPSWLAAIERAATALVAHQGLARVGRARRGPGVCRRRRLPAPDGLDPSGGVDDVEEGLAR